MIKRITICTECDKKLSQDDGHLIFFDGDRILCSECKECAIKEFGEKEYKELLIKTQNRLNKILKNRINEDTTELPPIPRADWKRINKEINPLIKDNLDNKSIFKVVKLNANGEIDDVIQKFFKIDVAIGYAANKDDELHGHVGLIRVDPDGKQTAIDYKNSIKEDDSNQNRSHKDYSDMSVNKRIGRPNEHETEDSLSFNKMKDNIMKRKPKEWPTPKLKFDKNGNVIKEATMLTKLKRQKNCDQCLMPEHDCICNEKMAYENKGISLVDMIRKWK